MTKILVIDDEELVRKMIVSVLKKSGFDVYEAANGIEGLAQAQNNLPDLVLTDILMPDKEGISTILELKTINPTIKIIAMSGGGKTQNMSFLEMAQKVGVKHTLKKPFRPTELLQAIDSLLNNK